MMGGFAALFPFARLFAGMLMAVLVGLGPTTAHADTTRCTAITTMPNIIALPGTYCLNSDFFMTLASGAALKIVASNVTLDLNAHTIGNLGAGTATAAVGVFAFDQQNVTIKNGTVTGFAIGIQISGFDTVTSRGHLIEDIRADQNRQMGIQVAGNGSIVRRCQVMSTGGSTVSLNVDSTGISVSGASSRVLDNDVTDTQAAGSGRAFGVQASGAESLVVADNRISGVASPSGPEHGIDVTTSPHALVRDNLLNNARVPANETLSVGIHTSPAITYSGNLFSGFGTSYAVSTAPGDKSD